MIEFASSRRSIPYPGPKLHQTRELHSTSSVNFAQPDDVIRRRLVQSKTEWMVVLPHLTCYVVPPSQLPGETVSVCFEDTTTNSAGRFCCEELEFAIGVVWLHQACGVHISKASPVQCSPFVVGRYKKSGLHVANNEFYSK